MLFTSWLLHQENIKKGKEKIQSWKFYEIKIKLEGNISNLCNIY